MANLRELFQQHRVEETVSPSKFATWAYNLLEAIVEELEAQRPPQVDARIVALTADRDSWERQCRNAERGLADAKAEIESLCKERDALQVAMMAHDRDSEIGRLVRGMPLGTQLRRDCAALDNTPIWMSFRLERCESGVGWGLVKISTKGPAEALRLIQKEVGDGEVL